MNNIFEFETIKEKWMQHTVTLAAKEKIKEYTYFLDEIGCKKAVKDTTDARKLIEKYGLPPLSSSDEAKEMIEMAVKESCLTPYQLERIGNVLVAVLRLKNYLAKGKETNNPLAYYEENLNPLEDIREEITRQIRNEQVDDLASKGLQDVRRLIADLEEKMRNKADQIMRSNKECMADTFSTMRNGRVCIPVKKDYKWKIPGSVIDKSQTGNTVFVEPVSVANIFEELQLARIEEENEVHRILYTLTAMVADNVEVMNENIRVIEKLDFIFSKGKLSLEMNACEPIINMDRYIKLTDARHPLMDEKECVPLQFEIGKGVRGIIITGPNTGGKTVSIKTVALNCLMAQSGLHVTSRKAEVCMNSYYLCDIGDGQNITENLSTFSAHIKNVLSIIEQIDKDSLVIMDELGSGTDPTEGMGIAIAILEELYKSECLYLVTTHYPEVKDYAEKKEGVINARMEFDPETLAPTYRMIIGEAGESCAFYIANKLGMPSSMLETAIKAAYGEKAVDSFGFLEKADQSGTSGQRKKTAGPKAGRLKKKKTVSANPELSTLFSIGDSVMVMPDKTIGIVCEPINEKGILRVQIKKEKFYMNYKRVKLHVKATELYPEDYDFSIIFDSVEARKKRHEMGRKLSDVRLEYEEN